MAGEREKRQKKAEKATHELIEAIDKDPYKVDNYYELSTILTEMQSFPQAEELLKKALTIFKADSEQSLLHYGLGNVFYSAGLYKEAIQEFQNVKDETLKNQAYLMLSQTYYAQNQYQQALVFALTASEAMPQDKAPKILLADCFLATGDFEQAKHYYLEALKIDAQDKHTLFQLGVIAFTKESQTAGEKYFQQVRKIDQNYYQKMMSRLSDLQKAIKSKDEN